MLKITKMADPITVEKITTVIYSAPGIGKTSLACTAEAPLLLDFDRGAHRSAYRKDTLQVGAWSDVANITASDLAPYKTVVVDTVGRALDMLTTMIIRDNPKLKGYGGALSLQGYGALKPAFIGWLHLIQSYGKDLVLVAHSDEQRKGEEIIERLDVQGGSKGEIYKSADIMGRLYFQDGGRWLNFSPTDAAFGKDPAQMGAVPVPGFDSHPDYLAGVIAQTKAALNRQSEASITEQERVEKLLMNFARLESPDDFTAKAKSMVKASPKDKALLVAEAAKLGFRFHKKSKAFIHRDETAVWDDS